MSNVTDISTVRFPVGAKAWHDKYRICTVVKSSGDLRTIKILVIEINEMKFEYVSVHVNELKKSTEMTFINELQKTNDLVQDGEDSIHTLASKKFEDRQKLCGIILKNSAIPEVLQQVPKNHYYQKDIMR